MKLKSLGRQTDLIYSKFGGEIFDRAEYLVVRTPSNPGFHWGNLLIYPGPPTDLNFANWVNTFEREFKDLKCSHLLFSWDDGPPTHETLTKLGAQGYKLEQGIVLTTRNPKPPPKLNKEMTTRVITKPDEWEKVVDLQVAVRSPEYVEAEYRKFKELQFAQYREMVKSNLGNWYGAFIGDTLVGDLGIFHSKELARFQNVSTHPDFRRRGICGTLVYEISKTFLANHPNMLLVMEADADYHAAKIYESVGFNSVETNYSLYRP